MKWLAPLLLALVGCTTSGGHSTASGGQVDWQAVAREVEFAQGTLEDSAALILSEDPDRAEDFLRVAGALELISGVALDGGDAEDFDVALELVEEALAASLLESEADLEGILLLSLKRSIARLRMLRSTPPQ